MAFISVICLKCALYTHTQHLLTHILSIALLCSFPLHNQNQFMHTYWSPVSLQDLKLPLPPGWFVRSDTRGHRTHKVW